MAGKKLLVLSDSHGSVSALKNVFSWANNFIPPDGTICTCAFLGDGLSDLQKAAEAAGFYCDWKLVRGNNDYDYQMPETAVFDFSGHRFLLCHGHKYSLYGGHYLLTAAAKSNHADAVLFGHVHVPYNRIVEGILLVCPGSVARPRSKAGATFAVIDCIEGEPLVTEFYGINEKGSIKIINI
ncbi:MAG: YfcE family phosphodiesterase [Treponema sp.]|nr:YfcE family phosphodiesterase [Treponema sp.]